MKHNYSEYETGIQLYSYEFFDKKIKLWLEDEKEVYANHVTQNTITYF